MLSTEECIEILDHDVLEFFDGIFVHCNTNTLEIRSRGMEIDLNESQKRLIVCLIKKICTKRDIINIVWYENHQRISDNNYHQLTFQLRALLNRHNLPANLLVTVPYYGLKLNDNQWKALASEQRNIADSASDCARNKDVVDSDSVAAPANGQQAEGALQEKQKVIENAIRTAYMPHGFISQNAFIFCMFVALLVFI